MGPVPAQWDCQGRSMIVAESHLSALRVLVAVEEVWDMDRPRFEHRPAAHPPAVERMSVTEVSSTEWPGGRTVHYDVAVAKHDHRVQCPAETSSTPHNRVQHCLGVRRRARDDAQYLGGRRLLVQCLGEFARTRFEFLLQLRLGFANGINVSSRLRSI